MNTIFGVGLVMVFGSAIQITRILRRSVVIRKTDFGRIEKRIRQDERRRVLEDVNSRKAR